MRADLIIQNAERHIGEREKTGNSGFVSQSFEKWMRLYGWIRGWAWCAQFCKGVWVEAYREIYHEYGERTMNKLFSPNVQKTIQQFTSDPRFPLQQQPVPGALMCWQTYKNGKPQTTGHIAIVKNVVGDTVTTIEGNTNGVGSREGDRVAEKKRVMDFTNNNGLRLRGFIHPSIL